MPNLRRKLILDGAGIRFSRARDLFEAHVLAGRNRFLHGIEIEAEPSKDFL
jgi:hypothetical protein